MTTTTTSTSAPSRTRKLRPVHCWAALGALFIGWEVVVLGRWLASDYFQRVPYGPSEPPTWMKVVLNSWQVGGILVLVAILWVTVVRGRRRTGAIPFDGLLCLALFAMAWQDFLSDRIGTWFTYNSYLVNMGSWSKQIPGWEAPAEPGKMIAYPLLFFPPGYVYVIFGTSLVAAAVMNALRKRGARKPIMIAGGLAAIALFDLIVEGFVFLPLGFYTYQGGHLQINEGKYYEFPLHEPLFVMLSFGAIALLRYFRDSQGNSVAERGIEDATAPGWRRTGVRFLAISGFVQLAFLMLYNVPNTFVGANSSDWPDEIKERSYFTSYICGQGTDYACPGSDTPDEVPFKK